MDNNSYEQFFVIQATVEYNKQQADEKKMKPNGKQMKTDEKLTQIIENLKFLTAFMMDQTNISKFFPAQKDALTPPDPTTVVIANRRDPPLDGLHYTKTYEMCTLKYQISSPKFYDLLIKKKIK